VWLLVWLAAVWRGGGLVLLGLWAGWADLWAGWGALGWWLLLLGWAVAGGLLLEAGGLGWAAASSVGAGIWGVLGLAGGSVLWGGG